MICFHVLAIIHMPVFNIILIAWDMLLISLTFRDKLITIEKKSLNIIKESRVTENNNG